MRSSLVVIFVLIFAAVFVDMRNSYGIMPLQSAIPNQQPAIPSNPKFIFARTGGTRYCGLDLSPVRLEVPQGFTLAVEGGAEIHCDPNPVRVSEDIQKLNASLFDKAWNRRGYLVGVYPSVSLQKPLEFAVELQPTQLQGLRPANLVVRYYDAAKRRWTNLPTKYSAELSTVVATLDKYPPQSGYPAFTDRFLLALFLR
jgi:hypothetical protein